MIELMMLAAAIHAPGYITNLLSADMLANDCVDANVSYCQGYVMGVADLLIGQEYTEEADSRFCPPIRLKGTDLVSAFIAYIKAHPDERPYAAGGVVAFALSQAYPCPALAHRH